MASLRILPLIILFLSSLSYGQGRNTNVLDQLTKEVEKQKQAVAQAAAPSDKEQAQKQLEQVSADAAKQEAAIVSQNPDNVDIRLAATELSSQIGDYAAAAEHATKAAQLSQHDPANYERALTMRAYVRHFSGDYPGATQDAKTVLNLDPQNKQAFAILKLSEGRDSNHAQPTPDDKEARYVLQSDFDDFSRQTAAAGRRVFDHQKAVHFLDDALTKIQLNDPQTALKLTDQALNFDPTVARIYMERAMILSELKRLEDAVEALGQALALLTSAKDGDPNQMAAAYAIRARLRNELKDFPNAFADAQHVLAINEKNADGYFHRAVARAGLGQKAQAVLADYEQAAKLDAKSYDAAYRDALARYAQGEDKAISAAPMPGPSPSSSRTRGLAVALILLLLLLGAYWSKSPPKAKPAAPLGGRIKLVRRVAGGGMGEVFEGWDLMLRRRVAVKKLRERVSADSRENARFRQEAMTTAALKHPHIVAIYDLIEGDDGLYLVFEYVEGETLQSRLESAGKLTPAQALEIIQPIADALDYAHAQGVIHRDLKPANVMIEKGVVKLMDFGIARLTDSPDGRTSTQAIYGTPAYMAPEQFAGGIAREADLYALGVCAYEMLAGRRPFGDAAGAGPKNETHFAPLPADLTRFTAFFKRALAADQDQRPHSGAAFIAAFKAV